MISLVVAVLLILLMGFNAIVRPVDAAGQALWEPPYTAVGVDYDFPLDGKFDYLMVEGSLNVSVAGEFVVSVLFPGVNVFSEWYILSIGVHRVQIPVDGISIWENGVDGPYSLTLEVMNEDNVYTDSTSFTTSPFLAADFAGYPAEFNGTPSDQPIDTDVPPDGLYDYVAIDVPFRVYQAGDYVLLLQIMGNVDIYNSTRLLPGNHTVRLIVPGFEVWRNHGSGSLGGQLGLAKLGGHWVYKFIQTNPYDWSTFEPTPAFVSSTVADSGVDTDMPQDGLFDHISFNVPLTVNESGDYYVKASLRTLSGSILDYLNSNTSFLAKGQGTIEILFNTIRIVSSMIDGPYEVQYWVFTGQDHWLESGSHVTQAYAWTSFDHTPLWPSGAVQDEYRDIDDPPDGVIDYYVARIPLTVNDSGLYLFTGRLFGMSGDFLSSNMTNLSSGTATVELSWPIWSFGPGGQPPNSSDWISASAPGDVGLFSVSFIPSDIPNGSIVSPPALSILGVPETILPDADSNGLYDNLVVGVNVSVGRSGPYTFSAMLLSVTNNIRVTYATNHTVLSNGLGQVNLTFPGWAIRESLLDGPYMVFVHSRPGPSDLQRSQYDSNTVRTYFYTPILFYRQFEGDRPDVTARWASTPPVIDGSFFSNEWNDAVHVDLVTTDTGRTPATALIANDDRNLYVALDVTGDRTKDELDAAGLAFDVMNLDDPDQNTDDRIGTGFVFRLGTHSFRETGYFNSMYEQYWLRQSPLDTAPPRAELSAIYGFGTSPFESTPHRIFEFRIPLTMLNILPGQTIGFAVYSGYTEGIVDASGKTQGWPVTSVAGEEYSPFNYARLTLASNTSPSNEPPSVTLTRPAPGTLISGMLAISGNASDSDGLVERVEVRVDADPWQNATGTSSWNYNLDTTALFDGVHEITVRAYDGEDYSEEVKVAIIVDNTPPSLSITSPSENALLRTRDVLVAWNSSDETTGILHFEIALDSGSTSVLPATNVSHLFVNLGDGVHCITINVTDLAMNSRSASVNFTIDIETPSNDIMLIVAPIIIGVVLLLAILALFVHRKKKTREQETHSTESDIEHKNSNENH